MGFTTPVTVPSLLLLNHRDRN